MLGISRGDGILGRKFGTLETSILPKPVETAPSVNRTTEPTGRESGVVESAR
jgi:hypothetical protein